MLTICFMPAPSLPSESRMRSNVVRTSCSNLALQFVTVVINWFEKARTDRIQAFEFRMTIDLSHDIVVYLSSDRKEPTAIYLILKALYTRDPTPDAPNN